MAYKLRMNRERAYNLKGIFGVNLLFCGDYRLLRRDYVEAAGFGFSRGMRNFRLKSRGWDADK